MALTQDPRGSFTSTWDTFLRILGLRATWLPSTLEGAPVDIVVSCELCGEELGRASPGEWYADKVLKLEEAHKRVVHPPAPPLTAQQVYEEIERMTILYHNGHPDVFLAEVRRYLKC
jgi:hypothetical protein